MSKPPKSPFELFDQWFEEAGDHKKIKEANAVNLATVAADGQPANRMVLLKSHDARGFVFFTNLGSAKGQALATNPVASMCFYWEALGKQIRIEGAVEPVSDEEADAYFATRARQSRIGAWASQQSQPLDKSTTLLKDVARTAKRFGVGEIPRPDFWSGFRLKPHRIEFWQRGEFRLHNRICYTRDTDGTWEHGFLYP